MKNINKIVAFALLMGLAISCKQDVIKLTEPNTPTPVAPTKGNADFTKYVALGNSLTSGYQAGALFTQGQQNSFPKMLAGQFALVGGGEFNQPDINSTNGFFTGGTNPISVGGQPLYLGRLLLQGTPPAPSPTLSDAASAPSPYNPAFSYSGDTTKLNNFGVPGIIVASILYPQTGDWSQYGVSPLFNPFYARFASKPGTSTILGDAIRKKPTFFTFDLGNNDVLGYAISGGDGSTPITSQGNFATAYNTSISYLMNLTAAKGVVSTIPNVTTIPYFFTVQWNAIPLDAATASEVTSALANNYNAFLAGMQQAGVISASEVAQRTLTYQAGQNPVLIVDETLTNLFPYMQGSYAGLQPYAQARQTTSTDLVLLSAGAVLGTLANPNDPTTVYGVTVPLGDKYILIPSETTAILTATAGFNATITSAAAGSGGRIAVADVNAAFATFVQSRFLVSNGVMITPSIVPPFAGFSEDAVHPNTRGYAYLANIFIDAINSQFSSTIPLVDLSLYPGTALPINP